METSRSSTVSTYMIFITGAIEAWKEETIACFDVPDTFLHTNCKEGDTCMLLCGQLAEFMVLIDPKMCADDFKM